MLTKRDVLTIVERMPEAFTFTELLAELGARHKIEEGLADLDAGRGIDHETAKLRLSRWIGTV
jgi:hypothetical protein